MLGFEAVTCAGSPFSWNARNLEALPFISGLHADAAISQHPIFGAWSIMPAKARTQVCYCRSMG